MRIPPYWTKDAYTGKDRQGKYHTFAAWGWSLESLAAAREDAVARAKRIFERVTSGRQPDHYEYLEHPLREEIVDSLQHDGNELAIITRNSYGAVNRRLTEKQQCFRARLTPKPWRCGCKKPPSRYPWDDPQAESKYREWQQNYEQQARSYATCRLLGAIGEGPSDERIGSVVSVHDRYTLNDTEATLA